MFFLKRPFIEMPKNIGEVLFMGAAHSSTTVFQSKMAVRILKMATRNIPVRISVSGYSGRIFIDILDCRAVGFHGGTHNNPKFVSLKYRYRLNKERSVYYADNN